MSESRADRISPMPQAQAVSTRKVIAFTLLFVGAAMPFVSALVRPANGALADVILLGTFAVLAAAAAVALTSPK